jgi:hypothetical protein
LFFLLHHIRSPALKLLLFFSTHNVFALTHQKSSFEEPEPAAQPSDGRSDSTGSSCSRLAVSDSSGGR